MDDRQTDIWYVWGSLVMAAITFITQDWFFLGIFLGCAITLTLCLLIINDLI